MIEQIEKSLLKNFWIRSTSFSVGLIILVFIDEYIKEGYIFNPADIIIPGTHENIALILSIFAIFSFIMHKIKGEPDAD